MKYIISFLCFFVLSASVWAKDACTNPDEYTVDKRCYVTDEQKQEKPYNAVVALIDENKDVRCSGTIVKQNNRLYLYTAKHCTFAKGELSKSKNSVLIRLENGASGYAYKYKVGDFYYEHENHKDGDANQDGDYAIYVLSESLEKAIGNHGFSLISDKDKWGFGPISSNYSARLIGYGALKVMSDKEIDLFKKKYIKFLKDEFGVAAKGNETRYGFNNGGVDTDTDIVEAYIYYLSQNESKYYDEFFGDYFKPKVSYCEYSSTGKTIDCQSWAGNSGCGIFDENGNIMAIFTRGKDIIGGSNHASSGTSWFYNGNIILLK